MDDASGVRMRAFGAGGRVVAGGGAGGGTLHEGAQPRRVRKLVEARALVALSVSSAVRRDRSAVLSADESLYSCAVAPGACMMMCKML